MGPPLMGAALICIANSRAIAAIRVFAIVFMAFVFWVLYEQNYTRSSRSGN
jgi:dipeptide/tripeptide permease